MIAEKCTLSIARFLRLSANRQMLPVLESGEETLVGGQAVMEGVMMRAPHSYCVAVRKPNGELATEERAIPRMSEKYPIFKLPILRGLGTLQFAANQQLDDGEEKPKEISGGMMALMLLFSLGVFIVVFKFLPLLL